MVNNLAILLRVAWLIILLWVAWLIIVVTHKGIKAFTGKVPENKRDAKI
jgi:hypothetical protein